MRDQIVSALTKTLQTLGISVAEADIPLEFTGDLKNGDFASSIALQHSKAVGLAPRELAEKIVGALGAISGVEKIEIAGPGFINFYLGKEVFWKTLGDMFQKPDLWGKNILHTGEKIMVEYTDPNPFKEFHIGHLMSNAIGEAIARLMEYTGAEVKRANYQGDVGPHVAKAIWGVQKLGVDPHDAVALGKAYAAGAAAYETDSAAKEEIDAINREVYDRRDENINEMYDAGREASLQHFEEIYKILGTKFDFYFFESETALRGWKLVHERMDIFEESEGAIVYKGEQDGLHTRVFITAKKLPTYETKDLGLAELKAEKWPFDTSITVTAHEQAGYFAVVLSAMRKIMPDIAAKIRHVSHGMMRFADGKMSSRTGNVVTGESLLQDLSEAARARATESRAEDKALLAQNIAVGAIKYQILKQASGKDIIFDRERALSLEGDSGPYLQYTYARASQVLARAAAENIAPRIDSNASTIELIRYLYRFPSVVERAAGALEPHLVATFLIEFAALFNRWYAEVRIVDTSTSSTSSPQASSAQGESAHKVAITKAAQITLKNGLYILGIPAPEKM